MAKPMTFKAYLKGVYSLGGDDNLFFFMDSPIESIVKIRNTALSPIPSLAEGGTYADKDRFAMNVGKSGWNPKFKGASYPNYISFVHPLSDKNSPTEEDGETLTKEYVENRDKRLHAYVRDFMRRVVKANVNCIYLGMNGSFAPSEKNVIAYNKKK